MYGVHVAGFLVHVPMSSLSRTISRESAADAQNGSASLLESCIPHAPATVFDPYQDVAFPPLKSRTTSHSLLSSSSNSSNASRKGRVTEIGVIDGNIGRASMSMPPPVSMSSPAQKYSKEKSSDSQGTEDVDKTPNLNGIGRLSSSYAALSLPDSAMKPTSSVSSAGDNESNRMSYSSLFSMGSINQSGPSASPSAASSTAGSMKGAISDAAYPSASTVSVPPALGTNKGDVLSPPTTATDLISVTTSSHNQRSGKSHQIPPSVTSV